jgi:hypothetical protein
MNLDKRSHKNIQDIIIMGKEGLFMDTSEENQESKPVA